MCGIVTVDASQPSSAAAQQRKNVGKEAIHCVESVTAAVAVVVARLVETVQQLLVAVGCDPCSVPVVFSGFLLSGRVVWMWEEQQEHFLLPQKWFDGGFVNNHSVLPSGDLDGWL